MNLRKATEIELKLIDAGGEYEAPRCEIIAGASATGLVVSGAYLEAAIQWGDYYLLFVTDDVPFEEFLSIYLLSKQWRLLDSAMIGCIYSTGSFTDLDLAEPNRVQFRFIGDTDWAVELFDQPRFRFPWLGEPRGVMREFGFSRHFLVRGNPKPERTR
jgi:hypothetical protein